MQFDAYFDEEFQDSVSQVVISVVAHQILL